MRLGTIVSSRSHVDLVCRLEARPPAVEAAEDSLGFGSFVRVGDAAVGVVYATMHQPPEPESGTAMTLANVLLVGTWDEAGGRQEVPAALVPLHAEVRLMPEDAVARFHQDPARGLQLRYVPLILAHAGPMGAPLLTRLLDGLGRQFPQERPRIAVLRKAVVWQATMGTLR